MNNEEITIPKIHRGGIDIMSAASSSNGSPSRSDFIDPIAPKEELQNFKYEQAKDRQRITTLETEIADLKDEREKDQEKINKFKDTIKDFSYEQALDRQRIAILEQYMESKDYSRRDFDLLAVNLRKVLSKRRSGMDYKAILNYFHFKSNTEAYRLMDKTAKKFPKDVKINNKNSKRKTIIAFRRDVG